MIDITSSPPSINNEWSLIAAVWPKYIILNGDSPVRQVTLIFIINGDTKAMKPKWNSKLRVTGETPWGLNLSPLKFKLLFMM